ncbi:MAG: hypothetical protein HC831_09725, partial [Chloroflexia bacterium]|nr:hypothetical protein [Chloroflexia bacterium]
NNYLNLTYQPNGNIQSKTDAATLYTYNPANKPHALIELENPTNIPSIDQSISYTSFNKVDEITEGDYRLKVYLRGG